MRTYVTVRGDGSVQLSRRVRTLEGLRIVSAKVAGSGNGQRPDVAAIKSALETMQAEAQAIRSAQVKAG
jgi:hypothetical protein